MLSNGKKYNGLIFRFFLGDYKYFVEFVDDVDCTFTALQDIVLIACAVDLSSKSSLQVANFFATIYKTLRAMSLSTSLSPCALSSYIFILMDSFLEDVSQSYRYRQSINSASRLHDLPTVPTKPHCVGT